MTILLNSLAALVYAIAGALRQRDSAALMPYLRAAALGAWLLHTAALLTDFLGYSPGGARFGWSLALSIMMWSIVAIYASETHIFSRKERSSLIPPHVWWGALVVCILILVSPPTRSGSAAVTSTALALFTGHWMLGFAAYGLFAVAVLHALWLQRSERALHSATLAPETAQAGAQGLPLLTLEKLMMRFVWGGFTLLTLSLLLGVVLGEQLTGRALRWDHKTVFSILAWVVFAGTLMAHHGFGIRGRHVVQWLLAGNILLLLAYAGTWFVREVLLGRSV